MCYAWERKSKSLWQILYPFLYTKKKSKKIKIAYLLYLPDMLPEPHIFFYLALCICWALYRPWCAINPRVLNRILKIGVKTLSSRSFTILLLLFKKLESEIKSWSEILQFGIKENSESLVWALCNHAIFWATVQPAHWMAPVHVLLQNSRAASLFSYH